jgi:hypothetical protein
MSSQGGKPRPPSRAPAKAQKRSPAEEFAYKVELWSDDRQSVEQILAVATSAAIAHAAFYAAAREFGDRYVTLKHKGSIINRWNGPPH